MSEPKAKKSKLSTKEFTFTKENKPCDRKLLVQKTIFHVNSETLIEHSHYFRAMFTSDFMEKGKSEIVLKEVDEEGMKMFLTALFEPEKMKVEDATELSTMCKVFIYFLATEYFVKFLVETKVYKRIADRDLLELGLDHGIPEMKEAIDNSLADRFRKKFPDTAERPIVKKKNGSHFKFDKIILHCLNLVIDFELQNLKETVETHLSFEYDRSQHFWAVEEKYVKLMSKYQLEELKNVIEPYALSQFVANHNKPKGFLENYVTPAIPVEMNQLKEAIENHYIAEFKQPGNTMRHLNNMLTIAESHNLLKVKDSMDEFFLNRVKRARFDGRPLWESLKYCWLYMNVAGGLQRSEPVAELCRMIKVSDKHELSKLKTHMEQMVSNGLVELIEYSGEGIHGGLSLHNALLSFAKKMMECASYSEIVKASLDHFFVRLLKRNINRLDVEEYSDYLRYCNSYNFVELKTYMEGIVIDKLAEINDESEAEKFMRSARYSQVVKVALDQLFVRLLRNNNNVLGYEEYFDYLSFCNQHNFVDLKTYIEGIVNDKLAEVNDESEAKDIMRFKTHSEVVKAAFDQLFVKLLRKNFKNFDSQKYSDYFNYCKPYELEELKKSIKSCLCVHYKKLKEGCIVNLSLDDLAVLAFKHDVHPLKKVFEADLINEFLETHSFENLRFAFTKYHGYRFKQFRETVYGFLKTVSLDDPIMKAGRRHILDLGTDKCELFLKALLRKSADDE